MNGKSKIVAIVATALCTVVLVAGAASAGKGAETKVTIKGPNGDFSGTVSSSKPGKCANNRVIWVYRQKGKNQNPSADDKVGSDTAEFSGGHYVWSTGNTGLSGKFYARAGKTSGCQADTSKTIKSHK